MTTWESRRRGWAWGSIAYNFHILGVPVRAFHELPLIERLCIRMDMNILLIVLMVVLLGFMFWNSRKRMAKMKAEQAEKARQTVTGAEVLLQGGIYGTIVEFDAENLERPAVIEIAPGVEIRVHSQAILRVVTPTETEFEVDDDPDAMPTHEDIPAVETIEETRARLENEKKKNDD